ncbi:MAG: hypothetical protein RJA10_965, partial [Pseudomonadota bacterium]
MTSPTALAAPVLDLAAADGLARQLLATMLQAEGGMWALKDRASGRYVQVDAAMARFFGREPEALVGCHDSDLFDGLTATALRAAEQAATQQDTPMWSEHRLRWQGRACDFQVLRACRGGLIASVWLDRGEVRQREQQLRIALEQLEQQQRANADLRRELADQALRDPASGLYTRAHFEDQLRREVDLSTREHREFALVLIELDPASDKVRALGEPAQAHVLEAVGRLLRGGTRAMDASCRYDDQRFAVLLS